MDEVSIAGERSDEARPAGEETPAGEAVLAGETSASTPPPGNGESPPVVEDAPAAEAPPAAEAAPAAGIPDERTHRLGWILVAVASLAGAVSAFPEWRVTIGSLTGIALLLWQVPKLQAAPWQARASTAKERWDIENSARDTLSKVIGGLFVLYSLYFTWQSLLTTQQGQITDRYTKAIEQLASLDSQNKPKAWNRVGAVYALERIARDSPRDHWPVMEVLCAYARRESPRSVKPSQPDVDVQAVITVLRRRANTSQEYGAVVLSGANLNFCSFRGAPREAAQGAAFQGASFSGSSLYKAHLEGVQLSDADFSRVHAKESHFAGAELRGAKFNAAQLPGADFAGADLQDSVFSGARLAAANLTGADLRGADLRGTDVTQKQLDSAVTGNSDAGKPTLVEAKLRVRSE